MLNYKHVLRLLVKDDIKISVEEYLFLLTVRFKNNKETDDWDEVSLYANLYYTQNKFYGVDIYKDSNKLMDWNLMIDKLVKQGYLLDYRTESKLDFEKLRVTEDFNNRIWTTEKDHEWKKVVDVITERCGKNLQLPNGSSVDYFMVSNQDFVKNLRELKEFWWNKITLAGNIYACAEFIEHIHWYLDTNGGLQMKFVTFLNNYYNGILRDRIIKDMEEEL